MTQIWHIFNIDAKQTGCDGSMPLQFCFFDPLCGLYDSLCVPVLPQEVDEWLRRGKKVMQPGPLAKLPVELIDKIYEELSEETLHVTVSLAVTCKHLLAVGKRHILRSMRNSHALWIGGRLICLGTHAKNDELPRGMLSDAELKEAREANLKLKVPKIPGEETKFVTFASKTYDQDWIVRDIQNQRKMADCHDYVLSLRTKLTPLESLEDRMLYLLCCSDSPTYPRQGPMVLWNITKGEYVSDDKISAEVKKYGDYTPEIGLAHALLSRICWSSNASADLWREEAHLEKLAKGPWAGDRFCISTMNTKPYLGPGKKWKDVTAEVDEWLLYLLQMNEV